MNKKKHRGSDFRAFLAEEGVLEEMEARALKRALALQLLRRQGETPSSRD